MKFVKQSWLRQGGLALTVIYSVLAVYSVIALLNGTFCGPPESVLQGGESIGYIAYLFFLGLMGMSGLIAIMAAYRYKGVFRVLYFAGSLAILSSLANLILFFRY